MNYPLRTAAEAGAARIDEPWGSLTWLASTAIGNAEGVTVGRVIIEAGQSNPRHSHTTCEEVLHLPLSQAGLCRVQAAADQRRGHDRVPRKA